MHKATRGKLLHEAAVSGISNAFFNGLAAWLLLRNGDDLGWSGHGNFPTDIAATAFILPLIVALIVIPLQQRKRRSGKTEPLYLDPESYLGALTARLPQSLLWRAVCFGLMGLLVIAPLTLGLVYLSGIEQFSPAQYAVLKGAWAGVMAALLIVPMVVCALNTTSPVAPAMATQH